MMGQIKDEYDKLIPIATPEREENVNTPPYLKIKTFRFQTASSRLGARSG